MAVESDPSKQTDESQFDWRIEDMGKVATNPHHPYAGRRILLVSMMNHQKYGILSFVTPNAAALALNVALNAAATAQTLRSLLATAEVVTPSGQRGFQYRQECLTNLYSFFEQSMIAATMSFQALELFANAIIGRRAKGKIRAKRRKQEVEIDAVDAERLLSTEEKLSRVVPALLNVPTPSGTTVWNCFKDLQTARDSTIHLKSVDMFSNYERIGRQSLFFLFLNTDARQHPLNALTVVAHFFPQAQPRWLVAAKELAKKYAVIESCP